MVLPPTRLFIAGRKTSAFLGAPRPTLGPFFDAIAAARRPGHMLRWDHCAGGELKHHMAAGRWDWGRDCALPVIDDPRAYELLLEYPGNAMRVWRRPWIDARIVEGYPVEYRVFVEDGRVAGVSSYYPQRPLPDSDETRHQVAIATAATETLAGAIEPPIACPALESELIGLDAGGVHFAADYLVDQSGAVLFLEGGPPHTPAWGADPCCFDGRKIACVALALREGS